METILVQEADEAILEALTIALKIEGYQICSLTDRDGNVLDMIRLHRPRLVLLDYWAGHYSGKQVIHWIKAHFPSLPVIAFSCDNQIDQEYRQYGFDGYLKKPFDLKVLYRLVRKYLPKHRRRHHVTRLA